MAMDRKQKIETLQKIAAGIDPRPPQVYILDIMTSDELELLLQLKDMEKKDLEEFLRNNYVETEPALMALIKSGAIKTLLQRREGDKLLIFEPSPGCEPIEETETIQQSVVKVPEQTTQRSEVKINSKKIIS